jgi:phosphate transport system permease protein
MQARAHQSLSPRRLIVNVLMIGLCWLALGVGVAALVAVLAYVVIHGTSAVNPAFFVSTPQPVGQPGGGMGNGIVGTAILVVIASIFGLPLGIGAGVYLAEHRQGRLSMSVRFIADVLTGIPSIAIGLFAYELLVVPFKTFSAIAGGFALGVIMLPIVTRTTEEMVRLVPASLYEAGLALGVPRWKVIWSVVLPAAMGGIVTGALLAIARVAGETAPLLFTAFGNQFWSANLFQPTAAMSLEIFNYAISPYDDWHRQAWAGALVLVALVLLLSVGARILYRSHRATGG